jgi:hypothetical protein
MKPGAAATSIAVSSESAKFGRRTDVVVTRSAL